MRRKEEIFAAIHNCSRSDYQLPVSVPDTRDIQSFKEGMIIGMQIALAWAAGVPRDDAVKLPGLMKAKYPNGYSDVLDSEALMDT